MNYHVVTTMNAAGWEEHGRRMAESFEARWPDSARLTIYAEGFNPGMECVNVRKLPDWVEVFKMKWGGQPRCNGLVAPGHYDYRFDAVKFCHKVGAMTDLGESLEDGVMIWLDADTFTHSYVTDAWLEALFPDRAYLAWLERRGSHPETGFVMFRCGHDYHRAFMESFRNLYTSGDLFKIGETHDAAALYWLAMTKLAKGKIPPVHSLSGDAARTSHPAINGPLGAVLDHMKGPRKQEGKSRRRDIVMPRNEPYWQDVR